MKIISADTLSISEVKERLEINCVRREAFTV
jgi:hypothetical protein